MTAYTLWVDAGTAEVLGAFEAAGVPSLVLKGPAIARWLYAERESRFYTDSDLLVRPRDVEAAERVLVALGFAKRFEDRGMPSWWREYASEWGREDGRRVDLHHTLPELGVSAESASGTLFAGTDTIVVGGHAAATLSLPARTLHVALHAAHHGIGRRQPLRDLERAVAQVDESVWRRAAALAGRLEAAEGFAAGLRLVPAGQALASRLGLPAGRSVEAALLAASPPPVALGLEQVASASGLRARAEIVWRKLFPPAEFMYKWRPRAAERRFGLALAYLWRPLWILGHAPRALRAWLAARRRVRAGRS